MGVGFFGEGVPVLGLVLVLEEGAGEHEHGEYFSAFLWGVAPFWSHLLNTALMTAEMTMAEATAWSPRSVGSVMALETQPGRRSRRMIGRRFTCL